ncbi:MAG: hypothetical protein EZS28_012458 [Streblomastix strix]|uniref:SPRY domain-containing protein n=1 Tax=Streblomastix strix TaxID=222440 RepID=A0A5J4WBS7_9EUKA|nr:MAG: hypothetical protein EZS28_012458 [Streblomastix strix]
MKPMKDMKIKKKKEEKLEKNLVSLEINNSNKSHYEISNLNNNQKKINKISGYSYAPISLTQTLEKGIFQIELEFSNGGSDSGIGIVRDSYSIPSGGEPFVGINCQHMATFGGGGYNGGAGSVSYKGSSVSGNKSYSDNQKVMMEYDSGKCTLTLFINNEQQPVYVSGIKEKVKFVLGMYSTGRTCIIKSLKKVSAPTAIHLSNEKAVQW